VHYTEAFRKLGYKLDSPRQDWSAEKSDGVCVTIWQKERLVKDGRPYLDLWERAPNGGEWTRLPGHSKRTRHLTRAVSDLGGRVDVIFVSGTPGQSYEDASPWMPPERKGAFWAITDFDVATGFFRAEVFLPGEAITPRRKEL
jgi:hypothetical protein